MNIELIWFLVGLGLTGLLLAVGHWAPWYLSKLQSYSYGVASIIAGFALWRLMVGDWMTPAGLVIMSAIGGATVWMAYRLDDLAVQLKKAKKAEYRDPEL